MLRSWKKLGRLGVDGPDGEVGHVHTMYFDDSRWTIRYFVVDVGGWLTRRQVLIPPHSVSAADWTAGRLHISLTEEQLKNSPDIDLERPVSRQEEARYLNYFNYPLYWGGSGLFPDAPGVEPPVVGAELEAARAELERTEEEADARNSHLRSAEEVSGYHIQATDGEVGHVEDFVFDDQGWAIRYLVIDTSNWPGGAPVLVAPSWADEIDWTNSRLRVDLTVAQVKQSPVFADDVALARSYEEHLHQYYGRRGYWSTDEADPGHGRRPF